MVTQTPPHHNVLSIMIKKFVLAVYMYMYGGHTFLISTGVPGGGTLTGARNATGRL